MSETSSSIPAAVKAAADHAVKTAISLLPESLTPSTKEEEISQSETEETTDSSKPKTGTRDNITVFNDAANFNVKHPLYSRWQLWFDSASKQDKAHSWEDALIKIIDFDSVEEFWGLYNNIVPPSLIHLNSNYYLFKEGIKPAWEDKANAKGGKWSIQLPRGKYTDSIDNCWLNTMLAAIGEIFETPFEQPNKGKDAPVSQLPAAFSDEVTGVIVSSRKMFYRINIWTRSSTPADKARIENIGRHLKYGVLGMDQGLKFKEGDKVSSDVEYVSHKDSQAKYSTKVQKWTV